MQSIDLKKIGNDIKVRRVKQGIQQTALAEMLDLFPIFIRRIRMVRGIAAVMIGIAFGKGLGALLFFWKRW